VQDGDIIQFIELAGFSHQVGIVKIHRPVSVYKYYIGGFMIAQYKPQHLQQPQSLIAFIGSRAHIVSFLFEHLAEKGNISCRKAVNY